MNTERINENNISRYSEYEKWLLLNWRESLSHKQIEDFIVDYGTRILTPFYETMLKFITVGDYVYSGCVERGGVVVEVIKDSEGFPLCVKVKSDRDTLECFGSVMDYISIDRIVYWDKWKNYRSQFTTDELWDERYFDSLEHDIEELVRRGELL